MSVAYIALGANLAEPARQVEWALRELQACEEIRLLARSRLYRSRPIGPPGQDDYCNAACSIDTSFEPVQLLHHLQRIESRAGRRRDGPRWGPRVLDLDVLHFTGVYSDASALTLPHPRLHERNFVLVPLAEVAPELEIDGIGRIVELAERLGREGLELW